MESLDVTKYPCPSYVNVANFVTVRDFDNDGDKFDIWKKQMMCLLKSQGVAGFVTDKTPRPENDESGSWKRTDKLVQGWILGSIGSDALDIVWNEKTAKDMWKKLEKKFSKEKGIEVHPNESPEESYLNLKLYKAARGAKGEKEDAISRAELFLGHKDRFEAILNGLSETALHVAVMSETNATFVSEVVKKIPKEKLDVKDAYGDTALHLAAAAGNIEAVRALVGKNPDLPYVPNKDGELPVLKAAIAGKRETLKHLIFVSEGSERGLKSFEGRPGLDLLCEVIKSELFDVALELVETYPDLAGLKFSGDDDEEEKEEEEKEKQGTCNTNILCALATMAERPSAFRSGENFNWYQSFIYHCLDLTMSKRKVASKKCFYGDVESRSDHAPARNNGYCGWSRTVKLECLIWKAIKRIVPQLEKMVERIHVHKRASELVEKLCEEMIKKSEKIVRCAFLNSILLAAENGISEIVEKILDTYPSVIFAIDHNGRHVFQLAAKNRYDKVFNIINKLSGLESEIFDLPDYKGNNLMHICGKLAPPHRLNLVPGAALQMQRELRWFKEMENFVHPSRRTQRNNKGQTPRMVFMKKHKHLKEAGEKWMKETASACNIAATLIATVMFSVAFDLPEKISSPTALDIFGISDAIALFTSITSMFMFISILTSRYAEEDFEHALPNRLCLGLVSLFVSIIFMLAAFSATMYIIFWEKPAWVLITMAAIVFLPVASFVLLKFPLLVEILRSTYFRPIFPRHSNRSLLSCCIESL